MEIQRKNNEKILDDLRFTQPYGKKKIIKKKHRKIDNTIKTNKTCTKTSNDTQLSKNRSILNEI